VPGSASLSYEVRAATAADVPELARLLALLGYPIEERVLAERLAAFDAAGEMALVADGGERLLGALTIHATPVLHRAGPVGRLTALVVDDAARGRGVGRALVRAAEAVLAARGCVLLEVTSNRRRTDAHAFYERLGFDATSFRFAKALTPPG
jgi:GNAT superfamily N-acetyltransferase